MKKSLSSFYFANAIVVYGGRTQQAMRAEPLSSYTMNPNSDSIPMVSAPLELVGLWKGTHCGLDDPHPVVGELEMAENGANVWSFVDGETGILMPQTGDGVEVIVGWQCIDVGVGYWWGQVPHSDTLWCNLFQVQEIKPHVTPDSDDKTSISHISVAYGGQGVGASAEGACPTSLTVLNPSIKLLQASFTRQMDVREKLSMTCNVPAGSKDRVQPSHNSKFHTDIAIPNPFGTDPVKETNLISSKSTVRKRKRLPVIDEKTCRAESREAHQSTTAAIVNSATSSEVFDKTSL